MNATFDRLYRQLGSATAVVLIAALVALGVTLVCALLGLPQAVISFRGVTASLGYVFAVLLCLFLVSSIVAAVVRWVDRRGEREGL